MKEIDGVVPYGDNAQRWRKSANACGLPILRFFHLAKWFHRLPFLELQ
jgi:hypothetical protein